MNPQLATKSSFELLQLQRLLESAPQGLPPEQQQEARRFFQKTEQYLEGENLLLGKLQHIWPLIAQCFRNDLAGAPLPSSNGDSPKTPVQAALEALAEIQENLKIAEGHQAIGL